MKKKKLIHYLLIICCVLLCFAFIACEKKDKNGDGDLTSVTVAGTFNLQTYYPVTSGYIYTMEWELYTNGEMKATVWSYDSVLGSRTETAWGAYYCGYNGSSYAIAYSFDSSSKSSVVLYYGTYIQTNMGNMELVGANSRGEFEGIVAKVYYAVQSDAYGCGILGDHSQYVVKGENASSVTAYAYEAYEFIGWSDGVQTATRTDVNVQDNIFVQALFRKVSEFYFLEYSAADGGSLQGETEQTVLEGRDGATVVAIPDVGYEFIGWSDGVQTATRTDVDVQADMSVTANFQIIKKECAFTYIVEGNGGSIQGETKQTIVEGTYGSTVTAVPDEGYRFVGWYDDTGRWASCVSEQTSLTPYAYWWDDSTTYYARFELIEYTYTYNTTIGGRLKGERTGQDLSSIVNTVSIHNDYTSETITAVPEDGYYFVRWSDGVQSAVRQDKNVYSDLEVTAEFVHYSKFTYIVDGIGGSIAGETYQEVVDGNYGSTVTAVPDEGYQFVGWYDAAGQWAWCVSEQTSLTPYADGWYNSTTYYARFELIE